jgi:serine/threonine protein kinase
MTVIDFAPVEDALVSCNLSSITPPAARTMKLEDLHFLKVMGSGITGKVYLVRDNITSKHSALKVIEKNGSGRSAAFATSVLREQRAMRKIAGSDFLCKLEASWHDECNFYLLMVRVSFLSYNNLA